MGLSEITCSADSNEISDELLWYEQMSSKVFNAHLASPLELVEISSNASLERVKFLSPNPLFLLFKALVKMIDISLV